MKEYIEERAIAIANYIIEHDATVRQTAKRFGISKSTVHTEVTIRNGLRGAGRTRGASGKRLDWVDRRWKKLGVNQAFSINRAEK